ncbi:MAG: DUF5024 domain-containing protein [Prevotella sp.]|nr:DUF5024 domain-containing protein [Prevotella sp.]
MKKLFFLTVFALATLTKATAQNKIDKLVDQFNTVGSASYTSVVERNPKTREVQKVVKVLKIGGEQARQLRQAFSEEGRKETLMEVRRDGKVIESLTTESPRDVRIYQLEHDGSPHLPTVKVTIIVKIK